MYPSHHMEYTTTNPFVPKATLTRYVNSIFELRLHLPGIVSHVDIVPHDNYILVTGRISPRVRKDCENRLSTVEWSDQQCGHFGRDVPVNLAPGTQASAGSLQLFHTTHANPLPKQLVVLECRQECDDYIVRFAIRNSHLNRSHNALRVFAPRQPLTARMAAASQATRKGALAGASWTVATDTWGARVV
ncbi:hypothetical protein JB92DRAFT_2827467 [Gautieria morchelliformis]|nr:hypothetical protein JB92DRAFT_2827467 [Gautieria morchelliformis]